MTGGSASEGTRIKHSLWSGTTADVCTHGLTWRRHSINQNHGKKEGSGCPGGIHLNIRGSLRWGHSDHAGNQTRQSRPGWSQGTAGTGDHQWELGEPSAGLCTCSGFRPHSAPRFSRETANLELREKFVRHWEGQTKLTRGWTWQAARRAADSILRHENTSPETVSLIRGKAGTQMGWKVQIHSVSGYTSGPTC